MSIKWFKSWILWSSFRIKIEQNHVSLIEVNKYHIASSHDICLLEELYSNNFAHVVVSRNLQEIAKLALPYVMKKNTIDLLVSYTNNTKQHLDQQYALPGTHLHWHWPNNPDHYNSKMIQWLLSTKIEFTLLVASFRWIDRRHNNVKWYWAKWLSDMKKCLLDNYVSDIDLAKIEPWLFMLMR
jgi:phenylpropionate dioxygenase-like ring-hydroxylating dioxygenase large terminal subunit